MAHTRCCLLESCGRNVADSGVGAFFQARPKATTRLASQACQISTASTPHTRHMKVSAKCRLYVVIGAVWSARCSAKRVRSAIRASVRRDYLLRATRSASTANFVLCHSLQLKTRQGRRIGVLSCAQPSRMQVRSSKPMHRRKRQRAHPPSKSCRLAVSMLTQCIGLDGPV